MNADIIKIIDLPVTLKKEVKFIFNAGIIVYELKSQKTLTIEEFYDKHKFKIREYNIDEIIEHNLQ